MEGVTIIYLALTFISIYIMTFFALINFENRKILFSYPKAKKDYFVSIIVPCYNEESSVKDTVVSILKSGYPKNKLEVIIVNDGSKDNTLKFARELEKKYANVRVIDKLNSGKADSLNQGIKVARGDIVGVVDADSFPKKGSIKKMIGYFDDPLMGAVTSFVFIRNKKKNFLTFIQSLEYVILGWTRKLLDYVDSVYVTNGPLSLYWKKHVLSVGGFDPNTMTEDVDLTWNLMSHGYKTSMCLDAKVDTLAPTKLKIWFRQRVRWGIGGIQALLKYKHLFLRKGIFGIFVLPFVSLSIFLSLAVFFFSSYLFFKSFTSNLIGLGYSQISRASLFNFNNFIFVPSILLLFMAVMFLFSMGYYIYVLYATKYESKMTVGRFFGLIFYIILYLMAYPLIWISAFWRMIRKNYTW